MRRNRSLLLLILTSAFLLNPCGGFILTPSQATERTTLSKGELLSYLTEWESDLRANSEIESFERDLRREFIYRLRFQIERRYQGNDSSLKGILKFLLEMEEQPGNRSLSLHTEFLRELNTAVETAREPSENFIHFVRQFTDNAGVRQTGTASEFLKGRAYLNGLRTESAADMTEETWNELMERINEESSSDFETPESLALPAPDQTPSP